MTVREGIKKTPTWSMTNTPPKRNASVLTPLMMNTPAQIPQTVPNDLYNVSRYASRMMVDHLQLIQIDTGFWQWRINCRSWRWMQICVLLELCTWWGYTVLSSSCYLWRQLDYLQSALALLVRMRYPHQLLPTMSILEICWRVVAWMSISWQNSCCKLVFE